MASFRNDATPAPLPAGDLLRDFESLDLGAVWLGHASVLLRIGGIRGLTILTDPVFSPRVGLRVGKRTFGMPRLRALPIDPGSLPPVDLVLLSHAHFDHLDRPSLDLLASQRTTVITARRTRRLIPRGFGEVVEMDWQHGMDFSPGQGRMPVRLSAHRPRHWGARVAVDRRRGFNSYLIQTAGSTGTCAAADSRRIFFAGDTADTDAFDGLGPIDLAIFGIGAYGNHWDHAHANPEQVWRMFTGINRDDPDRGVLMPIHHSTFELGGERPDEPLRRLLAAAGRAEHRVVGRGIGELWKPG